MAIDMTKVKEIFDKEKLHNTEAISTQISGTSKTLWKSNYYVNNLVRTCPYRWLESIKFSGSEYINFDFGNKMKDSCNTNIGTLVDKVQVDAIVKVDTANSSNSWVLWGMSHMDTSSISTQNKIIVGKDLGVFYEGSWDNPDVPSVTDYYSNISYTNITNNSYGHFVYGYSNTRVHVGSTTVDADIHYGSNMYRYIPISIGVKFNTSSIMALYDTYNETATNFTAGEIKGIKFTYYSSASEYVGSEEFITTDGYKKNIRYQFNLVPAQRKSDSVCGLYDILNNRFYPMEGTNITTTAAGNTFCENPHWHCGRYKYLLYINSNTCDAYDFENKSIEAWTVEGVSANTGIRASRISGNNVGDWVMAINNNYTAGKKLKIDLTNKKLIYSNGSDEDKVNGNYGLCFKNKYFSNGTSGSTVQNTVYENGRDTASTSLGGVYLNSAIYYPKEQRIFATSSSSGGNLKYLFVRDETNLSSWYDDINGGSTFPIGCNGYNMWTWNNKLYLSNGSGKQYMYNDSTGSWDSVTWNGQTNFSGARVFTDGEDCYMVGGTSTNTTIYKLDESTHTWSSYWTVPTAIRGDYFFTIDGTAQCGETARTTNFINPIWQDMYIV